MATLLQSDEPVEARASLKKPRPPILGSSTSHAKPALTIIFEDGQEGMLREVADALGQDWTTIATTDLDTRHDLRTIVGVSSNSAPEVWPWNDPARISIYFRSIDASASVNEQISERCDYEYLYSKASYQRRDLARYLSFILGQNDIHKELSQKARTYMISTTFPDVRKALPNLDIISVGADAIELRVDLLEELLPDGTFAAVPSLKYVGEQVMMLRQRTELPIIYTTRCTKENGRFPMEDPELFLRYLSRAIKWGCEYIDVELWLPGHIRARLASSKCNSRIISAFHDFSRTLKWSSHEVYDLFDKGASFGDIVKMIVMIDQEEDNYQLEAFRSRVMATPSNPPFSGLNMGSIGQMSRTLNKVFTPITHPLLPSIAAPGQLSAAELNTRLSSMGRLPKRDFYGMGSLKSTGQAMFIDKCFNELSLPHTFVFVERATRESLRAIQRRPNFGGSYINPALAAIDNNFPYLSDAARSIGRVDTVLVRGDGDLVGDNASWKGIRATLTRDFIPSAYSKRAALVLASAESDAAAAVFALRSLDIGPVYTIGFTATGALAASVSPVRSIEDLKQLEVPFALLSALPPNKSLSVGPLLKHYSGSGRQSGYTAGKVFVDLTNGSRQGDLLTVAATLGWTSYGIADVSAWTTVETLRLLIGQNVPYDFVRLASGRALY